MSARDGRPPLCVKNLGLVDYRAAWEAMRAFTAARDGATHDEIWLCEHPPIFTLGLAGKPEHRRYDIGVPLVHTDRGGQITYHGPGQLIAYVLLDLRRRGLTVKGLVHRLEEAAIRLLAAYGVAGERIHGAPGVYVGGKKIAALGLRVRNGCCYHGLSLNVDMDLSPFAAINPCGYEGMQVTQLCALAPHANLEDVARGLIGCLEDLL
ncbi:MAG: lipoyl(octanoyl) transferase LipB [Rhodocyclaceae bacterium]|nr:lipoyl(octanoyl) transferase LipB [Rhodocyclaceae bacterium]